MSLAVRVKPLSWGISVAGTIHDFTPGEVALRLEQHVPVGSSVSVEFNGSTFHGEVLYSNPVNGSYKTHIQIDDAGVSGLRRTPRFTVKVSARVFTLRGDGSESITPVPATIVDISGGGLGLVLPIAFTVGESIGVDSSENTAFGVVRHCRQMNKDEFRIGVELHHVLEKTNLSKNSFDPLGIKTKISSIFSSKPPSTDR